MNRILYREVNVVPKNRRFSYQEGEIVVFILSVKVMMHYIIVNYYCNNGKSRFGPHILSFVYYYPLCTYLPFSMSLVLISFVLDICILHFEMMLLSPWTSLVIVALYIDYFYYGSTY